MKNKIQCFFTCNKLIVVLRTYIGWKWRDGKIFQANGNQKRSEMDILILDIINFKSKMIMKQTKSHYKVDLWTTWFWTAWITYEFLSLHTLQYYRIHSWLNPWMENYRYGGPTVKLYMDFQLHKGLAPLNSALFKGQLY